MTKTIVVDHLGARILHFDHVARKRMQLQLDKNDNCQLEKHLNAYAVLDPVCAVTTGGYCIRLVPHY